MGISDITFETFPTDASRRQALRAARALARRLETSVGSIVLYSALKVTSDLHVFEKLSVENGHPKSIEEIGTSASPEDVTNGNRQHVTSSEKSHFEWVAERPDAQKTWDLMKGYASQPGTWADIYPNHIIVDERSLVSHSWLTYVRAAPLR